MSGAPDPSVSFQDELAELCRIDIGDLRRDYLQHHPGLLSAQSVVRLAEVVRQSLRTDLAQAIRAGDAALAIAENLDDRESLAQAMRAKANGLWFKGQCKPAVELLAGAIALFEQTGRVDELGRTLSTSIQPLILLGEYETASQNAQRAREIFTLQNDGLRLARLEINVANILHRQERYAEALSSYKEAYRQLLPHGDTEAIGVALHNIAVCLINLDDFEQATQVYAEAREFFQTHHMPQLVSQADYNIAYLYYLRGDYERAIDGLQTARENCVANGDAYHAGLCDLDQAEIYLELNLSDESTEMTQRAAEQFEQLGMGYEKARSLVNLAIAASRRSDTNQALEILNQARAIFGEEKHQSGQALVDLYQAVLLAQQGDQSRAKNLALSAGAFFRSAGIKRKSVLCDLLLSRLAFLQGDVETARATCHTALEELASLRAPTLSYQAHLQMGRIHEASGDTALSQKSYELALQEVETVRSSLEGEELKIGFMANKFEVYERLIQLCLRGQMTGLGAEQAFVYVERAKSRSLMDSILGRARPLPAPAFTSGHLDEQVRSLRGQLNWYYHRIESEELRQDGVSAVRIESLWSEAHACEDTLLRTVRGRATPIGASAGTRDAVTVNLGEIRAALLPGTVLVEYFAAGGQLFAAVMSASKIEVVSLTSVRRVRSLLRMLQLQLSSGRLEASYGERLKESLVTATQGHLRNLYKELIAPIERLLQASHLVFVPSGFMHHLPLHALYDGHQYLIDRFTVSYSPSASVYMLSHNRGKENAHRSLIFGIPDAKVPWVLREVEEVAAAVPGASVFLGAEATREVLWKRGASSRLIHIATHGFFRRDNPLFSAVRLGDSYLSLYDLYDLELPVELLTLSGCSTGLGVVTAGDEFIGLARGLLYAGAHTLLLTLWDVHDRSTAETMSSFYQNLERPATKVAALQSAMWDVRERFPHPYHWAPFILVGKGPQ